MKSNLHFHGSPIGTARGAGPLVALLLWVGQATAAPMPAEVAAEVPALSLVALTEAAAAQPAEGPMTHIESAARAVPLAAANANLFQLTLWNFIDGIRAQQRADYFQLAQTLTATLKNTIPDSNQVPAVPLPPAAWLFPAGLLSLVGLRRWALAHRGEGPGSKAE